MARPMRICGSDDCSEVIAWDQDYCEACQEGELATLRRELAEAREESRRCGERLMEQMAIDGKLAVELAEARRDGERLDWMILNHDVMNIDGWCDHADFDAMDRDENAETLRSWRKYIDATRGAK